MTRQNKENYYKKYFEENKTNLMKFWEGIKISTKTHPTCMKVGDKTMHDDKKISPGFNNTGLQNMGSHEAGIRLPFSFIIF